MATGRATPQVWTPTHPPPTNRWPEAPGGGEGGWKPQGSGLLRRSWDQSYMMAPFGHTGESGPIQWLVVKPFFTAVCTAVFMATQSVWESLTPTQGATQSVWESLTPTQGATQSVWESLTPTQGATQSVWESLTPTQGATQSVWESLTPTQGATQSVWESLTPTQGATPKRGSR